MEHGIPCIVLRSPAEPQRVRRARMENKKTGKRRLRCLALSRRRKSRTHWSSNGCDDRFVVSFDCRIWLLSRVSPLTVTSKVVEKRQDILKAIVKWAITRINAIN